MCDWKDTKNREGLFLPFVLRTSGLFSLRLYPENRWTSAGAAVVANAFCNPNPLELCPYWAILG